MSAGKSVTTIHSDYTEQYDAYIERKQRRKKRLIRRLVLFASIVLIVIGFTTSYHIKQRALQAEKQIEYEQLEKELAALELQEQNYLEEIKLLNNEEYVLEIARTNYFFSKEGELIFKILDESPSY